MSEWLKEHAWSGILSVVVKPGAAAIKSGMRVDDGRASQLDCGRSVDDDLPRMQCRSHYLYLHGAAMTAWFGLLLVQSLLIATGRRSIHRRTGIAGVVIAVVITLLNPLVVVWGVPLEDIKGLIVVSMHVRWRCSVWGRNPRHQAVLGISAVQA